MTRIPVTVLALLVLAGCAGDAASVQDAPDSAAPADLPDATDSGAAAEATDTAPSTPETVEDVGRTDGPEDPGASDAPDASDVSDVSDASDASVAGEAVDPGPSGCLGGTPLAQWSGIPHVPGGIPSIEESPWVSPRDFVRLDGGGWLVLGDVPLCVTDEARGALVHLDAAGTLLHSEHWEWNWLGPDGQIGQALWPFATGAVLVVANFAGYAAPLLSLESVAPDLSRTWTLSAVELGDFTSLTRLARAGSPDLHVLAMRPASTTTSAAAALLRISPQGQIAERHVLSLPLPARLPLPPGGTFWTAGVIEESGEWTVSTRFVAVEVGWDGTEGTPVEVGPFTWTNSQYGQVFAWPVEPIGEGYLVWASIVTEPGLPAGSQAWRLPLDGRAPWQVPDATMSPVGTSLQTPFRVSARPDGSLVAVANVWNSQSKTRPMRIVYPAAGGAAVQDGPAFDDAFAAGREWRLNGLWDLATGSLVEALVLKADAEKPHPSQWPEGGWDTVLVRFDAAGGVRWTRDYGGGVVQVLPESEAWVVSVPGGPPPSGCPWFTEPPDDVLFFEGVCD